MQLISGLPGYWSFFLCHEGRFVGIALTRVIDMCYTLSAIGFLTARVESQSEFFVFVLEKRTAEVCHHHRRP